MREPFLRMCNLERLLTLALASLLACADARTVAIDMTRLDDAAFASLDLADLYKSLLVRVMEEQLAAAPIDDIHDLTLRFGAPQPAIVRITAENIRGASASRDVAVDGNLADFRLQVMHESIALLRTLRQDGTLCHPPQRTPVIARHNPTVEVSAYATVGSGPGILSQAGVWLHLAHGIAWVSAVDLLMPLDHDDGLRLLETGAMTGLGYDHRMSPRLHWRTSLRAGVWLTHHAFDSRFGGHSAATAVDPALIAVTGIGLGLGRGWELGIALGSLALGRRHVYAVDGETIREVPQLRGLVGATVSCEFD